MEAIINYLDAMFANLPNTEAVRKAKAELAQMMEDKYNELISEGETENAAVGTVISEFGNLSELAEVLGLENEVKEQETKEAESPSRTVTMDETKSYLAAKYTSAWKIALGICLIILSPVGGVMGDAIGTASSEVIGVLVLFGIVAAGVLLIVFGGIGLKDWSFLHKEKCSLTMDAVKFVTDERNRQQSHNTVLLTVGIVLCSLCWIPSIVIDTFLNMSAFVDDLSGASIIIFVAIGVFLIVYSGQIKGAFEFLLGKCEKGTIAKDYSRKKAGRIVSYDNPVLDFIMSVYWPTVTCLFFIISTITFRWDCTWVIWPVAAIAHVIISKTLGTIREV